MHIPLEHGRRNKKTKLQIDQMNWERQPNKIKTVKWRPDNATKKQTHNNKLQDNTTMGDCKNYAQIARHGDRTSLNAR